MTSFDPVQAQATAQQFLADNPDIETVEVVMTDLNGVVRGKWLPASKLVEVAGGTTGMTIDLATCDIWGRDVPAVIEGTREGDGVCRPVMASLQRLSWLERPTATLTVQMFDETGEAWPLDPRTVLQQAVARLAALGLHAVVAPELEFYLFGEARGTDGEPLLPATRLNGKNQIGGQLFSADLMHEQAAILTEMQQACAAMGLPLESLVKELSPAQYEINLHHNGDILQAADDAQMLKRVIKGVAARHGQIASFMAKPSRELAGNGLHVHASLVDGDGNNAFGADDDLLRHAVAGLGAMAADAFLMFAPHRNSYRRFAGGHHAPMAPTWGHDNRNVALRIPRGGPQARRAEHRIAGADANVFLVLACVLTGMAHGIENKLDPGPACEPGEEHACGPAMARHWPGAIERFEASELVPVLLGTELHKAYAAIKRTEMAEFDAVAGRMEYDTYLVAS
ncbi:MAG: glutamine synthetase [Rhodospirillaceae bacterium]|jgi:glutamine synthetase|nr:glutamine synthetase [Rhodospirillaceae bacterium]MBT6205723.1 glutamine synthetase [Rhodospirillaceae bacterium]MBT7613138.1 glutamine synthetase [Rhodospirillaceae bacterium]MBT7649251.1 glutamine synthetase [Rhodospirillaceae bacterium]